MRIVLAIAAGLVLLVLAAVGGAIAFDSPVAPPPMASVYKPFADVDFSDLPAVTHYLARDGAQPAGCAGAWFGRLQHQYARYGQGFGKSGCHGYCLGHSRPWRLWHAGRYRLYRTVGG
jgi:hypothetical protein